DNLVVVLNKTDLVRFSESSLTDVDLATGKVLSASVKNAQGIDRIQTELLRLLGKTHDEVPFTARARHVDSLRTCLDQMHQASSNLENEVGAELVAEELKAAHISLGEIVGETTADDLLGRIFSEFCIGK
ncbi:MAG: tRNA uridine-5-carboxymethylaminomethyl(34) synthesis GTPase MnmE, partial [Pseudomonadota bacterium]